MISKFFSLESLDFEGRFGNKFESPLPTDKLYQAYPVSVSVFQSRLCLNLVVEVEKDGSIAKLETTGVKDKVPRILQ